MAVTVVSRWVEFAKCMREENWSGSVSGAKEARKSILVKQHDLLADKIKEIQKVLDRLDSKIERYEQVLVPAEKGLKKTTD